jgi:hypothetical protein
VEAHAVPNEERSSPDVLRSELSTMKMLNEATGLEQSSFAVCETLSVGADNNCISFPTQRIVENYSGIPVVKKKSGELSVSKSKGASATLNLILSLFSPAQMLL